MALPQPDARFMRSMEILKGLAHPHTSRAPHFRFISEFRIHITDDSTIRILPVVDRDIHDPVKRAHWQQAALAEMKSYLPHGARCNEVSLPLARADKFALELHSSRDFERLAHNAHDRIKPGLPKPETPKTSSQQEQSQYVPDIAEPAAPLMLPTPAPTPAVAFGLHRGLVEGEHELRPPEKIAAAGR